MRIPWLQKGKECAENAAVKVEEVQPVASAPEPVVVEPTPDVVALLNARRSGWRHTTDDGYVVITGELFNPTDQLLVYVEAYVIFERAAGDTGEGYIIASRLVELKVEVPPNESRPFTCIPEPRIDRKLMVGGTNWDYVVTRAELVDYVVKLPFDLSEAKNV